MDSSCDDQAYVSSTQVPTGSDNDIDGSDDDKDAPPKAEKGWGDGGAARGTEDGSEKQLEKLWRLEWGHAFPEIRSAIFSSCGTMSA